MLNLRKNLLLSVLFYILQSGILPAQNYRPCSIKAEYYALSHKNYIIDSSRVNVIVQILCNDKAIDYKIGFSEIWEADFCQSYCKEGQKCTVEEVVTKLNKQKKCAVIIEFSDGHFEFLSSLEGALTHFHNVNLINQYAIFHQDKGATFFTKEIYPECSVQAFIFGEKFRAHILFLEINNSKQKPINFITDWMSPEEFLHKKQR